MDKTRIASLLYPGFDRAANGAEPPWKLAWQQVEEIRALVRRHLPAITASLLAHARPAAVGSEPSRADPRHRERIGNRIDWYSDLSGQPIAFDRLSDADQARVVALVEDRLRSIRQLADELAAGPNPDPAMSTLLRQSARYPHPRCIYLVGDEPVLTYWGLDPPKPASKGARGPLIEPAKQRPRRTGALLLSFLALLALAGLAFGTWAWWQAQLRDRLQADLKAGLAAQCEPTALLEDLHARLTQIDPTGERFPSLKLDTEQELNRCADAADLDARLEAAWDDCSRLPVLADALLYQDKSLPPFAALAARLGTRLADCRLAEDLRLALTSAAGDCNAITALATENKPLALDGYPVAGPAAEIRAEAAACRIAAKLRPRLAETGGECPAVRALNRELGQEIGQLSKAVPASDPSRGALGALRADMDAALEGCALADDLTARFAKSQGDCVALFSLRETLSRQNADRPPFDGIARQLDASLTHCAALNDLETRFTQVEGHCDRVAAFSAELQRWRDNLRFVDIRARVALEQDLCRQADEIKGRIADLGMDCARLRGMAGVLAERSGSHFDQARAALKKKLRRCDSLARYDRRLKDAGRHCGRLKTLRRDLKRQTAAYLKPIRVRLNEALEPCRPKPKPALAKPPRGSGAYALSGQCSGNLVISPAGGYDGDRVRHIVSIAPPDNARIAKVVSDNRGCRNCRLTKGNATTWSVGLFYGCSGRGSVPIAYSAYDRGGKLVCSGRGVAKCLGPRR